MHHVLDLICKYYHSLDVKGMFCVTVFEGRENFFFLKLFTLKEINHRLNPYYFNMILMVHYIFEIFSSISIICEHFIITGHFVSPLSNHPVTGYKYQVKIVTKSNPSKE